MTAQKAGRGLRYLANLEAAQAYGRAAAEARALIGTGNPEEDQ